VVSALRVVFFGTPGFAVPSLDAIARSRHDLVAVVTQPDRPSGRGQRLTAGPVKIRAVELGVPVLQPLRLRDEPFPTDITALHAGIGVVAAYGKILPQWLLDTPRLGMINLHASLLPRWRGAAPVHRAILAGDRQTGVTIMRMVQTLDAGPMLARVPVAIEPDETSAALEMRLAVVGAPLLVETLDRLATGPVPGEPQDESLATYAPKLERHESQLDWAQPSARVHDRIRGLQPWPLAAARLNGRRVLLLGSGVADDVESARRSRASMASVEPGAILAIEHGTLLVATGTGAVRLSRIQPEGRPAMSVRDFVNGHPVRPGDRFEPLTAS
jgi:methionyl-tRNA formyltransferase